MTLRRTIICIVALLIAGLLPVEASAKSLKVGVVQTLIEPRLEDNLAKVLGFIDQAERRHCRLVVLPEHALLLFEAPEKPTKAELDSAFEEIRRRARSAGLCVAFADGYRRTEGGTYQTHGIVYSEDGTRTVLYRKNLDVPRPFIVDGVSCNLSVCSDRGYLEHSDLPCVTLGSQIIIDSSGGHGGDGSVKTYYAQLATTRSDLFQAGQSAKSLWFRLKGVPSIVTVGDDAHWVEIADLAANRGMYLHFHISYESDTSPDHATLRRQRNLLALRYAKYGAVVNAADPGGLRDPSAPAGGMSMIVSREGGHNQPATRGLEYYLPYQTSVVRSAGTAPAMIFATRRTGAANNMDLARFWRNRNRRNGGQPARYDWISNGTALIHRVSVSIVLAVTCDRSTAYGRCQVLALKDLPRASVCPPNRYYRKFLYRRVFHPHQTMRLHTLGVGWRGTSRVHSCRYRREESRPERRPRKRRDCYQEALTVNSEESRLS